MKTSSFKFINRLAKNAITSEKNSDGILIDSFQEPIFGLSYVLETFGSKI